MLKVWYFSLILIFVFSGCNSSNKDKKSVVNLDGKKLLQEKCSSCHNLDMPPKIDDKTDLAPPMMAVSFHLIDFIHGATKDDKILKATDFIKEYVINPQRSKSYCDKQSLKQYGLMPSLKGKVTQDELEAIAKYIFEHYTTENLSKAQQALNRLNAMPKGKRIATQKNCFSCHRVDKKIVGPSFKDISKRYHNNITAIKNSIKHGAKNRWDGIKSTMPPFKNLDDNSIDQISKWIISL